MPITQTSADLLSTKLPMGHLWNLNQNMNSFLEEYVLEYILFFSVVNYGISNAIW